MKLCQYSVGRDPAGGRALPPDSGVFPFASCFYLWRPAARGGDIPECSFLGVKNRIVNPPNSSVDGPTPRALECDCVGGLLQEL